MFTVAIAAKPATIGDYKMNRLSILAAMIFLGALAQTAQAVDDPHAAHAASQAQQGGQPPEGMAHGGGMQGMMGGGMHDMMMQHMQAMREHGRAEHKGYADVVLKFADELKLSDEQVGKISRIHMANQKKMMELGPKLHETLKAAHEVYLNPASDEAAIRKAAKAHNAVFDELVETALKTRSEINAILTPEQLKQLQSKKAAP